MIRNVIHYRDDLLFPGEGFIRSQGEALRSFRAYYAGLRRVGGVALPEDRVALLASSRLWSGLERGWFTWMGPTKKMVQTLAELQPELIHAHFGLDATHMLSVAQKLRVPLITTFYGYDVTISDRALASESLTLRRYIRGRASLQRAGTAFLCVSDFIRRKLLEKGFPAERTHVHYPGVDTHYFCPDSSVKRSNLIVFVGRLVENKGCTHLLKAMSIVRHAHPTAALAIIGDGPLRNELKQEARALRLENVRFLGTLPQGVIRHWLNRARVFCVPSVEASSGATEGFGLAFAEAQSMGVPVVSFKTGAIPEIITNARTGLLASPGDWRTLGGQIDFLLSSADIWNHFSAGARERALRYFDLSQQTAKLEQLYEQWITENQPVEEFPYDPWVSTR